ncbi:MAG: outer membrane beta-barrel protein [Terriglobia bacterium]
MRIPICILTLAVSAWAAAAPDPAPQQSAPAAATDSSKPADPAAPPPAPPAKYGGWVFSAMADAYYTYNNNHPDLDYNQLQNFNIHTGYPRFSLGKFTVDKSDKIFGIHLDVGVGETMRLIHAGDVAAQENKGLRYVEQMYLIAKPNNTHGTEIDFGQFVTSAGAEVIESTSNWNYSRSLLFAWAIPYYHFGFKANVPVTKEVTVGFQLVNAWNTVWGNNNLDNIALTLAVTKARYAYFLNYYEGPQKLGTTAGKRNLLDTTITLTPTSKFSAYVNGDYGRDNRIGGGYDQWYGLAGAARYQVAKMFAVAGRAEFFNDPSGFSTGTKQILKEGTLTLEAKPNDHFVGRFEYRHDSSNTPFFSQGAANPLTKGMNTITIGLVALLGPLK